jgi:succinate dehydrogenase/fumarate reductase flavoprotein subunit
MSSIERTVVETDVLVIGGGLAGCMAAIRAREMGAEVVIAEKADTRRSGCASTGVDHCWTYIPEIHGPQLSIEELVQDHTEHSGGFVDQEIATYIATHSYERLLDLERFGIPIRKDDGDFSLIKKIHRAPTFLHFAGRDLKPKLTRQARHMGAKIVNRVMVTDLLMDGNRVVGAVGVSTRNAEVKVFKAKAVVLSTGNIYRLYMNRTGMPFNLAFPPHETGDGHSMALRAGAELLNMEFTTFQTGPRNFHRCGRGTFVPGKVVDAYDQLIDRKRDEVTGDASTTMDPGVESEHEFERVLREGTGPIYLDSRGLSEKDLAVIRWALVNEGNTSLLAHMDEVGIDLRKDKIEFEVYEPKGGSGKAGVAVNARCETSLSGLYAAGDVIGGMSRSVAPGAFTMGWQAGEVAAAFAKTSGSAEPDAASQETLQGRHDLCEAIMTRTGPRVSRWQEAQAAMQNIMGYYLGRWRSESMMDAGLERIRRLKRDASDELSATNPHELYRCVEILSLMDSAEMIMVSARARQESRFGPEHSRADHPDTSDDWFCNNAMRQENGGFTTYKKPFNHIYG